MQWRIWWPSCHQLTMVITLTDEKDWFEIKAITLHTEDEVTYLQRELKRRAMGNSADLRGSRRLSLLCDFIGKVFTDSVNDCKFCPKQCPGCWEGVKRSCQGFLPASCLKAQSPTEEEVRTYVRHHHAFPSKRLFLSKILLYHPGNLLQSQLFEQNKEVLPLHHAGLLQQQAGLPEKRDWAELAHHLQSNRRTFSLCSVGCWHRRKDGLQHGIRHSSNLPQWHPWPFFWFISFFMDCVVRHPLGLDG